MGDGKMISFIHKVRLTGICNEDEIYWKRRIQCFKQIPACIMLKPLVGMGDSR
jgi:hypothetical protein